MITRCAYAMRNASSPAVVGDISPAADVVTAVAASVDPNAPNSTFEKDRFIALLIAIARIKPLRPSSAPTMIRMLLSMANPVATAASPAYEMSSDTTTGMSAPPIGNTKRMPNRTAGVAMAPKTTTWVGKAISQTMQQQQ